MYTNRDHYSSGGRNFQKRDFNKPSGPRQMFKAVCSSCGKDCEVPFMPSGNKPVYCSDCFNKQPDNAFKPRFENRNMTAPQPQKSAQLDIIVTKLDKIIDLLSSCTSDTCCQDDSCCQKETPRVVKEKPVKGKVEISVEKKVKAPKKSVKSPKK